MQLSIVGFYLITFGIRGRCLLPSAVPNALAKPNLKVTALTVAPSGWFLHHLPTSSDMDGRGILTCIMGDLAAIAPVSLKGVCAWGKTSLLLCVCFLSLYVLISFCISCVCS